MTTSCIFINQLLNMPVHPSEEEAPTGLTEKVAKNPSSATESTASDHPNHHNEHNLGGEEKAKASTQDFVNKGPQIPVTADGWSYCSSPSSTLSSGTLLSADYSTAFYPICHYQPNSS